MTNRAIKVQRTFIANESLPIGDTEMTLAKLFAVRLAYAGRTVVVDGEYDGSDTHVTGFAISNVSGCEPITHDTIRSYPAKAIINEALKAMVVGYEPLTLKQPRVFGEDELRRVRDIYWHAHVTHGPTLAEVIRTWNLPNVTAIRWVKRAQKLYDFPLKGRDYNARTA